MRVKGITAAAIAALAVAGCSGSATVPDLEGYPLEKAVALVEDAGLEADVEEIGPATGGERWNCALSDEIGSPEIANQNPAPGESVSEGSTVSILAKSCR